MSFEWTSEELQKVGDDNQIVIFMKGTPDQPQCGFSARGAQVVNSSPRAWNRVVCLC